jgi:hypothetical protein
MGLFNSLNKAVKQSPEASNTAARHSRAASSSPPPKPPKFDKVKPLDPDRVPLPQTISTDTGVTVTFATEDGLIQRELSIVGESYYQPQVMALAKTVGREPFPIFLVPEPSNPYDKKAVAVYAGGAKVGSLPREDAAAIAKMLLTEILQKGRAFHGEGRATNVGAIFGISGYALLPDLLGVPLDNIEPKQMTHAQILKATETITALADEYPETIAQVRSVGKKAAKIGAALAAHAAWVEELPPDEKVHADSDVWLDIATAVENQHEFALDAYYTTDADDAMSAFDEIDYVKEALAKLHKASAAAGV